MSQRAPASEPNVESIRAFWEAWTPGETFPTYRSSIPTSRTKTRTCPITLARPIGVMRVWHGRRSAGSNPTRTLTIELERIVGRGDGVVSIHHARSKARYTGIEDEGPLAYVWTFRDGKVIHFRSYRDPSEALEAAGLTD